ncbi:hypothetical protein T4D_12586 [Trichinella pseudospiralis]|uniref:Uncharacterized protein n=1 Tax=Trichinella pseudospiralis TaxID=6337 RepID=A0A0V1F4M9_TRIPS|nr:hypothetical protein T4D_12586 [Trichinella pseudospiralis]
MAPGLTKLLHFCYKKAVFAPAKQVLKNCQNAAVDMSKKKWQLYGLNGLAVHGSVCQVTTVPPLAKGLHSNSVNAAAEMTNGMLKCTEKIVEEECNAAREYDWTFVARQRHLAWQNWSTEIGRKPPEMPKRHPYIVHVEREATERSQNWPLLVSKNGIKSEETRHKSCLNAFTDVLSSRALLTPHYCYDHALTRPVPLSLRKSGNIWSAAPSFLHILYLMFGLGCVF